MNKNKSNEMLKNRIGFTSDDEIQSYRNIYLDIINDPNEEDFYNSMMSWWSDGNAPYYDSWLKNYWEV